MKFIHTADCHLGNAMHNIDRIGEVRAFFKWLKKQIEADKAEALVVSGDIFDTINPPVEARHEYYKFLATLLDTCCRNVIIIAGNHDSASFINAPKDLLEALNIHVVGNISNIPVEELVFELKDSAGNATAVCAAVPFVREADLRRFAEEGKDFVDNSFGGLYRQACVAADSLRAGRNIPVIATGHLYAANLEGRLAEIPCGEKTDDGTKTIDLVGNLGAVNVSVFPAEFDYVALGHIHYMTRVAKNDRIRYSGSPFVLGFDEVNIPRNVLLVDVQYRKRLANSHVIPLAIVFLLVPGERLDRTGQKRRHLVEDLLLGRRSRRMGKIHHQGKIAAFAFVQAERLDKLGQHLRGERLAASDEVEV